MTKKKIKKKIVKRAKRRKVSSRKVVVTATKHSRHVRLIQHTVLYAVFVLVHLMWSLFGAVVFLQFPQTQRVADQFSKYGLFQVPQTAHADTAGPSTAVTSSGSGWTTPGNTTSSNDAYAIYNSTGQTDLILSNFGYSIPSTATISGITVVSEGNGAGSTAARRQYRIGLTKNASALAGTRKTGQQFTTSDSDITSGSGSDLWGTTWTYSEINASGFGVLISDNDTTAHALNFDYVRVTITYTIPGDPTWVTGSANFAIYESSSTTWGSGTLRCSGTLTDDNAATVSCGSGTIRASTQYRVEMTVKNAGGTTMVATSPEGVLNKVVKGGWAGTTPTLGGCSFNDVGADDSSAVCTAVFSTNDVAVGTSTGTVNIAAGGSEGYAYLITTDTNPSTLSTSYLNLSIDTLTEDSSLITITADTTAPTITSVSSDTAAGSYKAAQVVDIDVTFAEAVTSTGNVTVTLETGVTDETCTFTVSNSTTGTCNYTVQAGDTSSDLDATISGTIKDQGGNSMSNYTPTTGLAANEAIVIDTTVPVISATAPAGSTSINSITSSSDVSYTLSEAIASNSGSKITMTRTSGTADGSSPHTCTLKGAALNTGAHTAIDLSDTTDSCTSAQSLVSGTVYTFAFDAVDAAGNAATTVSNTSVTFDTSAPTQSSLNPADNSTTVTANQNLAITFNEAVTVNTGNVTIKKTSDNSTFETISITSGQVTGSGGTTITINPTGTFAESTGYYVLIDSGALRDAAQNNYAGISSTTAWNFTTVAIAPTGVWGSTPSETGGYIYINFTANDPNSDLTKALVEYQSGSACSGSWTKASLEGSDPEIFPSNPTATYYDTGGVVDLTNSSSYQLGSVVNKKIKTASGANTVYFAWNSSTNASTADGVPYCLRLKVNDFTQDQATPATLLIPIVDNVNPTVTTLSPTDNATGVSVTANLVMTFSEAVTGSIGYPIYIKKTSDNSTVETIAANSGQVTGGGTNTITINPSVTLAGNTEYYVNVDTGAFVDVTGRYFGGISNTTDWSFTTASTGGVLGYVSSGYLVSQSIDLAAYATVVQRNALRATWSQAIPSGCTLTLKFRGTNTIDGGDQPDYTASPWGSQTAYSGSGSTVAQDLSGDATLQGKRFFQYRADLTNCTSNTDTPSLYDVRIDFE
jgi:methionine-rich copper-binding protein CopC